MNTRSLAEGSTINNSTIDEDCNDIDYGDCGVMDYEEPSEDSINLEPVSIQQNSKDQFIESIESQNQEEEFQSSDSYTEYSNESESDEGSYDEEGDEEVVDEEDGVNDHDLNESISSFFVGRFQAFSNDISGESVESDDIQDFNGMVPLREASYNVEWDKYIGRNHVNDILYVCLYMVITFFIIFYFRLVNSV